MRVLGTDVSYPLLLEIARLPPHFNVNLNHTTTGNRDNENKSITAFIHSHVDVHSDNRHGFGRYTDLAARQRHRRLVRPAQLGRTDDVQISTVGTVLLTNSTPELASLNLVGTLMFTNWNTTINATNVTVASGGKMTMPAPFTDTQMSNNIVIVCGNLDVAAGAASTPTTWAMPDAPATATAPATAQTPVKAGAAAADMAARPTRSSSAARSTTGRSRRPSRREAPPTGRTRPTRRAAA